MRVLLIYPPVTLHKLDVSPPSKSVLMGLGYIGSVLQKAGYSVKILDCLTSSSDNYPIDANFTRFGLSDVQILYEIKSFAPDVIGISCMYTSYFKDAHNVAGIVKKYNKDTFVIFGGVHTSTFPEAVMKDKNVDVAVIGEGEVTICELLNAYKHRKNFGDIAGIMYRVSGQITKGKPRDFISNLDDIPYPAWELLEKDLKIMKQENRRNKFLMRNPVGYLLTSRGCPKDCYFCSVKLAWGKKWRARTAKNIVDEIELLKNKYGYKEFHFVDDNSSVSKKRMHEICDELLKRGLNIKLAAPTGIAIDTLDKEILEKMKKAGFYRLCFGIETGDPKTQKIIKKRVVLNRAKEVISQANRLGFWTSGTFIIGFPHETMRDIKATINFAKESNMDFAIFYLLIPQPGTEVYSIFKQQGLIDLDTYIDPDSDDWYRISIITGNGFKTTLFSNAELQNILSKAYKDFLVHKLFSLQTYVNTLKKIKSIEDFSYLLRILTTPTGMLLKMIFGKKISNVSIYSKNRELATIKP